MSTTQDNKTNKGNENNYNEELERWLAINFIHEAGKRLKLSFETIATASMYLHKFHEFYRFDNFNRIYICCGCILLSCKAKDEFRRMRDIVNVTHCLIHTNNIIGSNNNNIETSDSNDSYQPLHIGSTLYFSMKDRIAEYEQKILRVLVFDLTAPLPHRYLLNYIHSLHLSHRLAQTALNIANDLIRTNLYLKYNPNDISCAVIFSAHKLLQCKNPILHEYSAWWEIFDCKEKTLKHIADIIKSMYSSPPISIGQIFASNAEKKRYLSLHQE